MLMIFLMTGCGNSHINKKHELIIGLDDNYAPFGFRDEKGELVGFDIDLAEEVAVRMGTQISFKPIDWKDKYLELNSGKIDIIWSGFNITPEREKRILFSKPYMINRQIILVAKGNNKGIVSAADLTDKIVGTQLGSPADGFIRQNEKLKNSFAKLITYDNYDHAFQALADGEVEAVVCDELVVRYEMSRHQDKFETVEATVGSVTGIAVGFRKGDVALLKEFQKAFDEVIDDGTAQKISQKWFHADLIKSRK